VDLQAVAFLFCRSACRDLSTLGGRGVPRGPPVLRQREALYDCQQACLLELGGAHSLHAAGKGAGPESERQWTMTPPCDEMSV